MFSNEHTGISNEVGQLDFDTPIPNTSGSASSLASAEQKPLVVNGVQTGDLNQFAIPHATRDAPHPRRTPILIPASGSKSSGTMRPPKGRRVVVHTGVTVLLAAIVIGTLVAVIPVGSGEANGWAKIFNSQANVTISRQNNTALISAQAATATAVTQDGYDAGNQVYAGVQNNFTLPDGTQTGPSGPTSISGGSGISSSSGTIADSSFNNQFTAGQCTYWANYEYHHLTGYAVPWSGNASAWSYNALGYVGSGWVVSSTPHVPSIIVLQPGVQYAGWAGHVAVVEKINSDGSVATTNWNVIGWGVFSWGTYSPGPGVSFVWHR